MIWTSVFEDYPENAYIHPYYDGQGTDGRQYRPIWHAVRGVENAGPTEAADA